MKKYLLSILVVVLAATLSVGLSLYFQMVPFGIFLFITGLIILFCITAIRLYKTSKRLAQAERQLNESQERVLGQVSTPINTILGVNETLQKAKPDDIGHYVSMIDSAAREILQAVHLQKPETSDMKPFNASNARILTVHESELLLETIRALLKDSGAQIEGAKSIEESLARLSEKSYDLIFMDCNVDLQKLHEAHPDFKTPIIALSASKNVFSQTRLQLQGFTDILELPFSEYQLKELIRKYLSKVHSKEVNPRHLFSEKRAETSQPKKNRTESRIWNALFNEKISVQFRTINLTLIALCFFGLLSNIITIINTGTEHYLTFVVNTGLIFCVLLCLYISVIKKRSIMAGFMCVSIINLVGVPIMYFSAGGLFSGMPIWLAFALLLPFMVLRGETAYVAYFVSVIILAGCCIVDYLVPGFAHNVYGDNRQGFLIDVLQSMIFTSFLFGLLSQYRFYINGNHAKRIEENSRRLDKSNSSLKEANQTKETLIFNVLQYIHEPLANIADQCASIQKKNPDASIAHNVNSIKDDCEDLIEFSDNLQDFVNIDKDKAAFPKESFSMKDVLQDVVQYATASAQKKNLEFKLKLPQSIPSMFTGDGDHLRQVLKTIISDILKCTDYGFIRFSLQYENLGDKMGQSIFLIEDSGIGMRPEEVQHVLLNKKLGFRLALASKILEKMDSKLLVKSTYSEGSEFSFTLISPICDSRPVNL
ncbi:MAG: response regulator [Fibrobacter sp.]|nr:response regulator [Fibrobacter sp.]